MAGNIAFGLGREERGDAHSGDRVAEMLDLVELPADFRTRRPDELSGGQQQRVALARSLAPRPAVVLLDEPFSSLDASLRGSTARAVRRALALTNTTALLVTHDQNEALSLADQVAVMRAGRLIQSATPNEVYLSPSDPQVAEFVGRAVVLPGTAAADRATCALGEVVLSEPADGPVTLVIRPEQIFVDRTHDVGARGTVEELDYYGHDSAVRITLADGTPVLARVPGVLHPVVGDTVHLRVTGLVRAYPSPRRHSMTLTPLHPSTRPVLDHARFADALAVIAGDTHLTHRELADRVAARAQGWGPARRLVLVEGANTLGSLVAYLAAVQHGHVALVVPGGRDAPSEAIVRAYDPDIVCRAGADDVRRAETRHDLHPDLALLLSTSGSTGSPKLVRLSRDNVASNAAAIADYLDLGAGDRAITALPLHYCYGLSVLHSHLVAGRASCSPSSASSTSASGTCSPPPGRPSFAGVPHTFELLAASRFEERELPALRHVTQAGGRLAPESVRRWAGVGRDRGWDLVVMYGQTEATARMAWLPPALADQHPGSIGIADPRRAS